jgi:hypothetical protein
MAMMAGGRFIRVHWYERGLEHGNPDLNSRFRVNAPEASLLPDFVHRPEVRGNGMMPILISNYNGWRMVWTRKFR